MPGRILLIDAISSSRIVLRCRLAANCYDVFTAAQPEDALSEGRRSQPDLIVLCHNRHEHSPSRLIRRLAELVETRHAPILVLSQDISDQDRIALLRAGAEDVLDREDDEELLMARMRVLMRRRAMADEVMQRDSTHRQFDLAEPALRFRQPGQVAIVSAGAQRAQAWKTALAPHLNDTVTVSTVESALAGQQRSPAPDVFVIACKTGGRDSGLRLLSELRSRSETRHAALIALIDDTGASAEARRERAAMALDIGAADVVLKGFHQVELALRIQKQMAFKKQADHLRSSVRAGLRMAICDPLTGLYNRRYALPHLGRIAAAAQDRGAPFATMLLDLDRFKHVNDTYGHAAGDRVLVTVAQRLRDNLRSHDLLARIGGEEFLVAMPDADDRAAREAADRLRDIVRLAPVALPDVPQGIYVTCSIGVSVTHPTRRTVPSPTPNVANLIENADGALYQSKAHGRDTVTFARPAA